MAHARNSSAKDKNPDFVPLKRTKQEGNDAWVLRAIQKLDLNPKEWSFIALFGAIDILAFRLRVAQSHLRNDLLPSYWSESAFINVAPRSAAKTTAIHVPLFQPEQAAFATKRNGVVEQPLSHFSDATHWENVCVIALPVPQQTIRESINRFQHSRSPVDSLEHILRWLAYAWGADRTPNPIHEGIGMPGATMLEAVYNTAQFDVTPGLESRAACPEYLWIMAKYWYPYYQQLGTQQTPRGFFHIQHTYDIKETR